MLCFIGIPIFSNLMNNGTAAAKSIVVDSNGDGAYRSIQAAVNNASDGDTIYVWSGVYKESVSIDKRINLIGNGSKTTEIDGSCKGNAITVKNDRVNISGFFLKTYCKGEETSYGDFSGVHLLNCANVCIYNNIFSRTTWGIRIENSCSNRIYNNQFNQIFSTVLGQGTQVGIILVNSNSNYILNNTFNSKNQTGASIASTGIYILDSSHITLKNNIFISCGLSISSDELKYWNSHNIDTSNRVNDRPIYYLKNQSGIRNIQGAGQIIFVNCSNMIIENTNLSDVRWGIIIGFSKYIKVVNNVFNNNYQGIIILNSNFNIIDDNIFKKGAYGKSIYLKASSNNTIKNNFFYQSHYAINLIEDSSENVVENNTFHNSKMEIKDSSRNIIVNNSFNCEPNYISGIDLYWSDANYIFGNVFKKNYQGLNLYYSRNNDILYNNITDNEFGIRLGRYSANNKVFNNTFSNNTYGIYLDETINNNIKYNRFHSDREYGIFFEYSFDNKLYNNSLVGCGIGFHYECYFDWTLNSIDDSNTINFNPICILINKTSIFLTKTVGQIIIINCEDIIIRHQNVSWGSIGIQILNSDNVHIMNNNCDHNKICGIFIYGSNSIKVENNTCNSNENNGAGINSNSKHNIIKNNDFNSNGQYGLGIYGYSNSNLIQNNLINNNQENGIRICYSENNIFMNNTITNNKDTGIDIYKADSNIIKENKINYNTYGIQISGTENELSYNTLIKNRDCGIIISESGNNNYNLIHHNDFIYNSIGFSQAQDRDEINYWNSDTEGNFWSDWCTPDRDLDNIVDYPYFIYGSNNDRETRPQDNYPLTRNQTPIPNFPPHIGWLIKNFEIYEDTTFSNKINLNDWFIDINCDLLSFSAKYSNNFTVKIFENGSVSIRPKQNWNGIENISFFASDLIGEISVNVTFIVLGSNDPPELPEIIEPKNNQTYDVNTRINFTGSCYDVDEEYGDFLNYTWVSNISGVIGYDVIVSNILLPISKHNISLIVTDLENETKSVNITILIIENVTQNHKMSNLSDEILDSSNCSKEKLPKVTNPEKDFNLQGSFNNSFLNGVSSLNETIESDKITNDNEDIFDESDKKQRNIEDHSLMLIIGFIMFIYIIIFGFFIQSLKQRYNRKLETEKKELKK